MNEEATVTLCKVRLPFDKYSSAVFGEERRKGKGVGIGHETRLIEGKD